MDIARWGLIVLTLGVAVACQPKKQAAQGGGGASPYEANCTGSGGTFDSQTGFCQCPTGQTSDSERRCISGGGGVDPQQACLNSQGQWDPNLNTCQCGVGQTWTGTSCVAGTGGQGGGSPSQLQTTCQALPPPASWNQINQSCDCGLNQVLIGSQCGPWPNGQGIVTQMMCTGAIFPGQWSSMGTGNVGGTCTCITGQPFAPEKGGCPNTSVGGGTLPGGSAVTLAQVQGFCTQAGGQWDTVQNLCQCLDQTQTFIRDRCQPWPAGNRILTQQMCQDPSMVLVPGVWSGTGCTCQGGIQFEHRRGGCVSPTAVGGGGGGQSPLAGQCQSAGGQWDPVTPKCDCGPNMIPYLDASNTHRCTTWSGLVTADVCQKILAPGQWNGSQCLCQNSVFNAPHGGCVTPTVNSTATSTGGGVSDNTQAAANCQSSGGVWRADVPTCDCPSYRPFYNNNTGFCQ